MIITRSRDYTISMGPFETFRFGASVTLSHADLGYSDELVVLADVDDLAADISRKCVELLDEQLVAEIREARSITENEKSFLLRSFTTTKKSRIRKRDRSEY